MAQTAPLLARIFADAGNTLKGTASGFVCGHEPVHASKSGTCVVIDATKSNWFCRSCEKGGDIIAAMMSPRGMSREEAKAYLASTFGETPPDSRQRESHADLLVQLAKAFTFFHDEFREPYAVLPVNGHQEIWRCRSKAFKQYLRHRFFQAHEKAPSSDAVQSAIGVMEGWAMFDRPMVRTQ